MEEAKAAVITQIKGKELASFLLSHGIVVGTVFRFNYSPSYSGLVSLTISNRMVTLRKGEFQQISWEWGR